MILGISLPPAWLAGESHPRYSPALGDPATALAELHRAGVGAVELRAIGGNTDPELARDAAMRVLAEGLELTIHGLLPHPPAPIVLAPALRSLCRVLALRGQSALITVHSYESREETAETLADRTADAVQALLHDAERTGCAIQIALELNRMKGLADPSTSYAHLLAMRARIGHPGVGFCWDLGHTFANVCQGVMTLPPPDDFLRLTIHTHIHDLSPDGITHWPLTEGRLPLDDCLGALADAGYAGILNLELEPSRLAPDADVRGGIFASIARLIATRKVVAPDA